MKMHIPQKGNYSVIARAFLKRFPSMFVGHYIWFLIAFFILLAFWWGWIFYSKVYNLSSQEFDSKTRTETLSRDTLGAIESDIMRREVFFANPTWETHPDPFLD